MQVHGSDGNYGRIHFYLPATLHCCLQAEEAEAPWRPGAVQVFPVSYGQFSLSWAILNMASKITPEVGHCGWIYTPEVYASARVAFIPRGEHFSLALRFPGSTRADSA